MGMCSSDREMTWGQIALTVVKTIAVFVFLAGVGLGSVLLALLIDIL